MSTSTNPFAKFIPGPLRGLLSRDTSAPTNANPAEAEQPDEDQPKPPPLSTQIKLSDKELKAIGLFIDESRDLAQKDHQDRKDKCADQEFQWRNKVGLAGGEEGRSNFKVPITLALCFAKHAREVEAVFGAKASVTATPTGPSDTKSSKRVGLAMSWQFYQNMKGMKPLALCMLRRIKHGRSFAFIPWSTKAYNKFTQGTTERVVYKRSPDIIPLGNDEIMLPADVEADDTVQTASWVARFYKTTATEMLLRSNEPGEPQQGDGDWYQGIEEHFEAIVKHARGGLRRDLENDSSKTEADLAEGVQRDMASSVREYLEVEEWYIKWRLFAEPIEGQPSDQALDTEETLETAGIEEDVTPPGTFRDQGILREMMETDLVIRYIRDMKLIVGVQRLDELYPDTPTKRPIMEFALLNDGHYWCMGLIELAQEIEKEMTALLNQVIEGTGLAIAPPVFHDATAGDLGVSKYEKYDLIAVQNAAGIKQMDIRLDLSWFSVVWMVFQTIYEQLTGLTQQVFGRGLDQPNSPKTLGGQRLVAGANDIRLALDMRMLSEDLKRLLEWIWDLWRMMGSEQEVYRVAEGDIADFEIGELEHGWAKLGPKEFQGRYDFTLEFADDMQVREGKKQEILAYVSTVMQFPFVQMDAAIQHRLARDLAEIFGFDPDSLGQEPAPGFMPRRPADEWNLMLQGEKDIHPHQNDDHRSHLAAHEEQVAAMYLVPPEDQDRAAMELMISHILETKEAIIAADQAAPIIQAIKGMMMAAQGGIAGAGGGAGQQNPLAMLMGGMQGGGQPPMGGAPPGAPQI